MNCFTEEQINRISNLIREVEKLSDVERLFLYLQLPCGRADASEIPEVVGKSKFNGSKANSDLFAKKPDQETTQTYTWILSHLEVDPNVSLPKQEVYDEYRAFCQANKFEPLCVADFGKAMKHAFPCIKPRRLGQRGNSRYCYSGLRKKYKIQPPNLPDMIEPTFCMDNDCSQAYNQIIKDCRDNPDECPLGKPIFTVNEVMNLKIEHNTHHYPSNGTNGNTTTNTTTCGISNNANFTSESHSGKQNSIQHHPGAVDIIGSRHNMRAIPQQATTNTQHISNIHPLNPAPSLHHHHHNNHHQQQHHHHHEYTPSNPIPITGQSTSNSSIRCSYGGVIQQPGTPDDDDYQHNYQDIPTPINRSHVFSSSGVINTPISHHQHHQHQQAPPSTSCFTQLQPHSSKLAASSNSEPGSSQQHEVAASTNDVNGPTAAAAAATNNHLIVSQQASFATSDLIPQPSSSSTMISGNCSQMQFSHMNSSLIDSCASPFQSPASTPYPQMSYMNSDIQDYYSTNDCLRYSG